MHARGRKYNTFNPALNPDGLVAQNTMDYAFGVDIPAFRDGRVNLQYFGRRTFDLNPAIGLERVEDGASILLNTKLAKAWEGEMLFVSMLKRTDFMALPAGNYDLQGKDIYVQVIDMTTKPFAETRPEVHREYIDVQFLVQGREKIGVASDTGKNAVAEDLLAQRDLLFYAGMENESTLTMTPGSFAVFFPSDVHRPACAFEQQIGRAHV